MKKSILDQAHQQFLLQQKLIKEICHLFLSPSKTEASIVLALQMIGEVLNLDQAAILNYQRHKLSCLYDWHDPNKPAYSKAKADKALSESERQLLEDLALRDIDYYIPEKDSTDTLSLLGPVASARLFMPVFCGDDFWGLLAFTRKGRHKPWSETEISLGQTLAAIFAVILSRRPREEQLQNNLTEAKQIADQASQAKAEFLARMSHEMHTPLNAIIGMTDIALSAKDIGKKEYCLNKIYEASKHLLNVINDILDVSKMETNRLTLYLDEFDFEHTLTDIINTVNVLAREKQQKFIVDFDPKTPRYLIGDELRINQVISNLLVNAIKFTPNGGTIRLNMRQLTATKELHTLQVEVIDTGIGISEAQQAHLFDSFEQADGGMSRKYGGTGLGLAICKHIINLMGGDIRVRSTVNQGSAFAFTMRLQTSPRQAEFATANNIRRSGIRVLGEANADLQTERAKRPPAVKNTAASFKPISYIQRQETAAAAEYGGFLPLLDVQNGLIRGLNNKALYFTLLHNFSGRALVDDIIMCIKNNDYKRATRKTQALRGVAANLGLNGLLTVVDEVEEHAKMEVFSPALIGKLEDMLTRTLQTIDQLLKKEGIV